ncbi:MAG: hypothetical protein GX753_01680 [Erysipelothrix sp.]|nr:hypothetical protein [Erysipelothrix sp.]
MESIFKSHFQCGWVCIMIDAYLKSVTDNIKYVFIRHKIREELKSHIEDAIVFYIEDGYDRDFAVALALKDMGDPQEIVDGFNKVYHGMYYLYFALKSLTIGLVLIMMPLILFPLFSRVYEVYFKTHDFNITDHLNVVAHQEMDEIIYVGNYEISFKDAYLTDTSKLVLVYEDKKINPFITKHNTIRHIETCGTYDCMMSMGVPSQNSDAMYMFPPHMGAIVIFDQDTMPQNIDLKFKQLNNTHLNYRLEVRP